MDYEDYLNEEEQKLIDYADEFVVNKEEKIEDNKIEVKFNIGLDHYRKSIALNVKRVLMDTIKEEIRNQIKEYIKDNTDNVIKNTINQIIQEELKNIYENGTLKVNVKDGWNYELKEINFKEFVIDEIRKVVESGNISYNENGYSKSKSFANYINDNLVGYEIKNLLDKNIKDINKKVTENIKNTFNESTKELLSQQVFNILTANDTYKKLQNSILQLEKGE